MLFEGLPSSRAKERYCFRHHGEIEGCDFSECMCVFIHIYTLHTYIPNLVDRVYTFKGIHLIGMKVKYGVVVYKWSCASKNFSHEFAEYFVSCTQPPFFLNCFSDTILSRIILKWNHLTFTRVLSILLNLTRLFQKLVSISIFQRFVLNFVRVTYAKKYTSICSKLELFNGGGCEGT